DYIVAYSQSRAGRSGGLAGGDRPRLEAPATSQNAPCDARQLVGKRDRQHIVVQPLPGSLDPGFEPVALPALRPDQDDPGSLHEQHAQVAIAALGYLAKDRAVPRRDLPRDQPQPSGEVAAPFKRIPGADRTTHSTRDNRPQGHSSAARNRNPGVPVPRPRPTSSRSAHPADASRRPDPLS